MAGHDLGYPASAWLGFTPGFSVLTYDLALSLVILAAVIERPFVSRAGVSRFALARSLQANALTTLLGFATFCCGPDLLLMLGPVGWVIALVLATGVEVLYYGRFDARYTLRHGPIAWGNIVSAVVIFAIPHVVYAIQDARPQLRLEFEPYQIPCRIAAVVLSVLLIVGSFVYTGLRDEAEEALAVPGEGGADFEGHASGGR